MTPKEKARELLSRNLQMVDCCYNNPEDSWFIAKRISLLTIGEMIKFSSQLKEEKEFYFWLDVRSEFENSPN